MALSEYLEQLSKRYAAGMARTPLTPTYSA